MDINTLIGFISLIISCIAFGFMFAPLRNFDCKDGFYIQWVQCAVVFVVGFVINCATGFPSFNPIAMIGGALFATGNILSVPIVKGLGIGVGMLIWGSIQVLVGWSVARFGLFGTRSQPVNDNGMNIAGLALTLFSGFMFVYVRHESQKTEPNVSNIHNLQIEETVRETSNSIEKPSSTLLKISANKLIYIGFSCCLALLHGLMLTPIVYIQDTDKNAYKNVLNYMFAHFSTVFAFSSIYFGAYCIYKRGKPYAPPNLILPSVAYGVMWSIGMVLFFVSNQLLSQTVSFPITTRLPSTIGVFADIILFKTIKGNKNLLFALTGIAVGLTGVVLIALSNQQL